MNFGQFPTRMLAILLTLTGFSALAAEPAPERASKAPYLKGEFILSRNYSNQNPVCQRFTQNLNQFRTLDFKTCHPRLSEKFPEFSRAKWEEIPFNLQLAEQLFKSAYHPSQAAIAERHWQQWQEAGSAAISQGRHVRMWRSHIDLDSDGSVETIIRMMPKSGLPVTLEVEPPWSCDYNYSSLHITDNNHTKVTGRFDSGNGADIIYAEGDRRYYQVIWIAHGPIYPDIYIDEAARVVLSKLSWDGFTVTGSAECVIDWVPAGRNKPMKRRH